MADLATTLRAVLAVSDDAGVERRACPDAAAWEALLRTTPGQSHPWIAACAARRFAGASLPGAVRAALDAATRSAAVGHLQRQALLRRLVPSLDAAGVPFVLLKGAALARTVYPAPLLRTMGDIDLWTLPEHLDSAARAAVGAGLRYHTRLAERIAASERLRDGSTRLLQWPDSRILVELHASLRSLRGMSPDWLAAAWGRRERRALGDCEACVLHPEDMLTHLVVHCGRHHRFEYSVRALVDIGLLLEREGGRIAWPALLACWRREGIETWGLLALVLARDLVGAPVPVAIASDVRHDPEFRAIEAAARRQVLEPQAALPPGAELLSTSTTRDRAMWLLSRFTTWYWKGPPGHRRRPMEVLRDGARRIEHDLCHRVPRYVRGIVDGTLRGAEFRRRRAMAFDKRRLDDMVAAADAARARARDPRI